MKRPLFATVTMALISRDCVLNAGAWHARHGGPGAHFGQGVLETLLDLDLTDAQRTRALAPILSKYRDEGRERRAALRTAMEELRGRRSGPVR